MRNRRSSCTVLRWLSRLAWVMASGPHAVRFEEKSEIQLVRGQHFKVVGAILAGGAIHTAAIFLDELQVLALADVGRPLEHHVFEQVREAGVPRLLDAGSHVVHNGDRGHRRAAIFHQQHPQAIAEFHVFISWNSRLRGKRCREQNDQERRGREFLSHRISTTLLYLRAKMYDGRSQTQTAAAALDEHIDGQPHLRDT
jgi:hypothetical protein